jgi:N-acetylglucosaminyldiphosphoundecaprenol N-acetyl-beta-D-mannosaminyltransferase
VVAAGLTMRHGGVIEVHVGNVRRDPKLFQKLGLEWLYRAVTQPSRFKRIMKLPGFLFAALRERGREKK